MRSGWPSVGAGGAAPLQGLCKERRVHWRPGTRQPGSTDGLFDRRGDRWGDPGHFVKSHSKLYLWGVLGFPPPTFRGRVEGTNLYWAPGMECRREPWCVTKIVKITLQVLKPSKLSEVTLKTLLVNFARLGWRDAPGGAPKAHSILGPRGGNSEKISEAAFVGLETRPSPRASSGRSIDCPGWGMRGSISAN